ncbi:PQQ-binding-like beta-propeller repeat protein [Amycolatopsis sp. NPDC021455]|uniref:WD40 repeat domain-containing protein n=1 Tax=Amycolatopsis sp. NPDC021455 TaxID=3154901 RepID=UPI0033E0B468
MGVPGTRLHEVILPMPVSSLGWTPDGKHLAVSGTNFAGDSSGGKVAIVDASHGTVDFVLNQADPATDSVSVSADGLWMAVSGQDAKGVLAVEDANPRCTNPEFAVADQVLFGPDGRFVAAVGSSTGFVGGLQVWVFDAATGETKWRSTGPFDEFRQFGKLAYSPDSRLLAAIRGGESFVFDAVGGDLLRALPDFVESVAFTPDSKTVVAGMTDGTARMIDVASGATVVAKVHDVVGLGSVAVSRDGRWAAAVVEPGPAVFGTATGELRFGPLPDLGECTKVVYGPDLRTIAVNQIPGDTPRPGIAVLSAATGAVLWSDEGPDIARDLAYSPDGSRIAVGGIIDPGQGYLRLYEVGGELLRIDHGSTITQLALARTAPVAVTGTADQNVRMYRVDASGDPLVEGPHPSPVTSVAIGADGLSAVSGCLDGHARLFKALFGLVWKIDHGQAVNAVAISPAGDLVATGCADRTARALEFATGAERWRCPHPSGVTAVVFSPDGSVLATASNRSTVLVDAGTGQAAHRIDGDGKVRALAFGKDGLLAIADENGLRLVDSRSGTVTATVPHPRALTAVSFSTDGLLLASGGVDRQVRIFPLTGATPGEPRVLDCDAPIRTVVFRAGDKTIAVATESGMVTAFEVATGFEQYRVAHPAPVRDLAFTADGGLLVTACDDGILRVVGGRP